MAGIERTQGLTRVDVLDICAVMLQRCNLSADELARHMARPELPSAAPVAEPEPVTVAALPAAPPAPAPKPVKAPKAPKPTIVHDFVQTIAHPTGETIIPAHVVIQRAAPAVDTRLQVKPGDVLTGGFSTSRPGINPITGKGWGVAA
jgi:hypothetical protein